MRQLPLDEQLFTPGQYDMLTIERPEKQRKPRPEAPIVEQLRLVFIGDSDRTLWQVARRLYASLGVDYTRAGLDALAKLPGWSNAIIRHGVSAMTQVTRIEQAAAASDALPREMVAIQLDLKKRQALIQDADQAVVYFLQELHTAHPVMRKQIKAAAEMVVKASFNRDVEHAPELLAKMLQVARQDKARLASIKNNYRTPKETAQWLIQILVRL